MEKMQPEPNQMLQPMEEVATIDGLLPASVQGPKQEWALEIPKNEPLNFRAMRTTDGQNVLTDDQTIPTHVAIESALLAPHRARLEKDHDEQQRFIYWPFNWSPNGAWKEGPHLTRVEWMCYKQMIGHLRPISLQSRPISLQSRPISLQSNLLQPQLETPPAASCPLST
jgi:hypothetical protein